MQCELHTRTSHTHSGLSLVDIAEWPTSSAHHIAHANPIKYGRHINPAIRRDKFRRLPYKIHVSISDLILDTVRMTHILSKPSPQHTAPAAEERTSDHYSPDFATCARDDPTRNDDSRTKDHKASREYRFEHHRQSHAACYGGLQDNFRSGDRSCRCLEIDASAHSSRGTASSTCGASVFWDAWTHQYTTLSTHRHSPQSNCQDARN